MLESSPITSKMRPTWLETQEGSVTSRHSLLGYVPGYAIRKVGEREEKKPAPFLTVLGVNSQATSNAAM